MVINNPLKYSDPSGYTYTPRMNSNNQTNIRALFDEQQSLAAFYQRESVKLAVR